MPLDRSVHPNQAKRELSQAVHADIMRQHLKRKFFYFHFRHGLPVSRSVALVSLVSSLSLSAAYAAALAAPHAMGVAEVIFLILLSIAASVALLHATVTGNYSAYHVNILRYVSTLAPWKTAAVLLSLPSLLINAPGRIIVFVRIHLIRWLTVDRQVAWRIQGVFSAPAAELFLLPLVTVIVLLRASDDADHATRSILIGVVTASAVAHLAYLASGDRFAAYCRICILSPTTNYLLGIPLLLGLIVSINMAISMSFGATFAIALRAFQPEEVGKFLMFSSIWSVPQAFAQALLNKKPIDDALETLGNWQAVRELFLGMNAALFYSIAGGFTLRLRRLKATPADRELIAQAQIEFTDYGLAEQAKREIPSPSLSSSAIAVRLALGRGDIDALITAASQYSRISGQERDIDQIFFAIEHLASDVSIGYAENLLYMLDRLREPDVALYHYAFMRAEGSDAICRAIEHPAGRRHARLFELYVKSERLWREKKVGWVRKLKVAISNEKTIARRAAAIHIASSMLWGLRGACVDKDTLQLTSIIAAEAVALVLRKFTVQSDYERSIGFLIVATIRVAAVDPKSGSKIKDALQNWSVEFGDSVAIFHDRFQSAAAEWQWTEGLRLDS